MVTMMLRCAHGDNGAVNEHPLFDSLFYDAAIDVTSFHACLKLELAHVITASNRSLRPPNTRPTAVVVGVEYGTEVVELAANGFNVIGLEPFPEFVTHTLTKAADAGVLDRVNIYTAGAGASRGQINITYYQGTVTAPLIPLDNIINNRAVDILSIDVHGDATNLDVLVGGMKALQSGQLRSIWVEIFPSSRSGVGLDGAEWGSRILRLLQKYDYTLYDVRWTGGAKSCETEGIPSHMCTVIKTYGGARPLSSPAEYMAAMRQSLEEEFQYVQTDVIALPRTLARKLKSKLQNAALKCRKNRAL